MNLSIELNKSTPLCEIMGRNGSDKGNIDLEYCFHNYTILYYTILKDKKDLPLRIFELGIGTNNINIPSNMGVNGCPGASLFGWAEFFVNSEIYGADIDNDILFETDRIKTFYCDQTDANVIKTMWDNDILKDNFDIIIEDGLHTFEANVCFFENSIHKLKKNGYYIIEDIKTDVLELFKNKIKEWELIYNGLVFNLITLDLKQNKHDNNLLVIYNENF